VSQGPKAFQDYLAGEPLNEENAALKRGEDPMSLPQQPTKATRAPIEGVDRDLRQQERADLKEMREGPGWPVLERLIEKAFRIHERGAISLSQQDPLGNRDRIAEEWAYVTMVRRAGVEITALVDAEVAQIETKPAKKKAAKRTKK
jgi:hypothetical protein